MLDDLPCSLNEPRDATGAYLVFWWNGAPLGHAVVHAGEFPLNEADLQRRALRATAPAVGYYSLGNAFKPAWPVLPQIPVYDRLATLESLVALERPLKNLEFEPPKANQDVPSRRSYVPVGVPKC